MFDQSESDRDSADDFILLSYVGRTGVVAGQLYNDAFRTMEHVAKERSLSRLERAGLIESATSDPIVRTQRGHEAVDRITAKAQRDGWHHYETWAADLLYVTEELGSA